MQAHFCVKTSADGVVEREFTVGDVPGILWSPVSSAERSPLVLMAHSGGLSKRSPGITARARHYAGEYGFRVAAIDAPGHGDRPRNRQDRQWVAALMKARDDREPMGPIIAEYNGSLAERAVPEWQATLDALQALPEIGPAAPVGFGGMTLGTATGLMLMAAEPRIAAASLGGVFVYDALLAAATRVTAPVELLLPWDDEEITRQPGLELFDRIGSTSKMLHVHPGRHNQVPRSEVDSSARFFLRHLVGGDAGAA
jgi:pimeloyl-ACP methyl ester carboxylesterase